MSFAHLQFTPALSFFRVDFLNDIFSFCWQYFFAWMSTVYSIYLVQYSFYGYLYALLESMLLSVIANPSRNWTFQRFAMVAEKERTQRKKKKKRHSLGFEPSAFGISRRRSVNWASVSVGRTWNLILITFTHLQFTPPLSFFRMNFLNDIFSICWQYLFYGSLHLILFH